MCEHFGTFTLLKVFDQRVYNLPGLFIGLIDYMANGLRYITVDLGFVSLTTINVFTVR